MTEDDEFNLLEKRLNQQKEKEMYPPLKANQPITLADTYNQKHDMEAEAEIERQLWNEHQVKVANARLKANEKQVGGSHYQKSIQPWDYIIANELGYLEGNVVKYVSRWKEKGGLQDLKKAQHYLQKLIEVTEK